MYDVWCRMTVHFLGLFVRNSTQSGDHICQISIQNLDNAPVSNALTVRVSCEIKTHQVTRADQSDHTTVFK